MTTARAAAPPEKRVAVIGAGVAGLTSALRLQLAHPRWRVVVLADAFGEETTTSGAAGIWGPYKLSQTDPRDVLRWSAETFAHLSALAHSAEAADAGVGRLRATTLLTAAAGAAARRQGEAGNGGGGETEAEEEEGGDCPLPYWADAVGGARAFSRVPDEELRLYSSGLTAPGGLPPLPPQLCRFAALAPAEGRDEAAQEEEAAAGAAPWGPDPHAAPLVAGYTWPTAVCEGRAYLRWLARAFRRAGGRIVRHRVRSVAALAAGAERVSEEEDGVADDGEEDERGAEGRAAAAAATDAAAARTAATTAAAAGTRSDDDDGAHAAAGFDCVVDAAGLRAPELFPDDAAEVYPIRGHVLRVKAPWVKEAVFANTHHNDGTGVYVLPNRDCVVIGGTGGVGDGDRRPRAGERAAVLRAALALVPSLARAEPVGEWVGLRPGRTRARVGEVEWVALAAGGNSGDGGGEAGRRRRRVPVVHDYGLGGSGLTLAWGCAADVLAAAEGALLQAEEEE